MDFYTCLSERKDIPSFIHLYDSVSYTLNIKSVHYDLKDEEKLIITPIYRIVLMEPVNQVEGTEGCKTGKIKLKYL